MPNHRKESTGGIEKVSQLRGDEEVEVEDKNTLLFIPTEGQSQKKHWEQKIPFWRDQS